MTSVTGAILLVACGALAGAVLLLAITLRRQRAEAAGALAAIRAEQAAVERRLVALEIQPEASAGLPGAAPTRVTEAEYVITRLGDSRDTESIDALERPDARVFADLVLRESVVKAASFAHGVRRGLSGENRNRIRFEMRRELKRARKQRKADEREAVREWRAHQRTAISEDDAA